MGYTKTVLQGMDTKYQHRIHHNSVYDYNRFRGSSEIGKIITTLYIDNEKNTNYQHNSENYSTFEFQISGNYHTTGGLFYVESEDEIGNTSQSDWIMIISENTTQISLPTDISIEIGLDASDFDTNLNIQNKNMYLLKLSNDKNLTVYVYPEDYDDSNVGITLEDNLNAIPDNIVYKYDSKYSHVMFNYQYI